jgi:membrane-associated phospholipid phosphatase
MRTLALLLLLIGLCSASPAVAPPCPAAATAYVELRARGKTHDLPRICLECHPWNLRLFRLLNRHHADGLDAFFRVAGWAGNGVVLLPILGWLWWRRRARVAPLLWGLGMETTLVQTLKETMHQPRPAGILPDVHLLYPSDWGAFPSGDTALAWVIVGALLPGAPRWGQALLVMYGLFVAYARIYTGVHFPLDVLVGAGIGWGCAWLALRLVARHRATRRRETVQVGEYTGT